MRSWNGLPWPGCSGCKPGKCRFNVSSITCTVDGAPIQLIPCSVFILKHPSKYIRRPTPRASLTITCHLFLRFGGSDITWLIYSSYRSSVRSPKSKGDRTAMIADIEPYIFRINQETSIRQVFDFVFCSPVLSLRNAPLVLYRFAHGRDITRRPYSLSLNTSQGSTVPLRRVCVAQSACQPNLRRPAWCRQ